MKKNIIVVMITILAIVLTTSAQDNYIRLTEHPDLDGYPVFSQDGSKIYFNSLRTSNNKSTEYSSVWQMKVDGSNQIEIIKINPPLSAGAIYPPIEVIENSKKMLFKEVNNIWEIFMIDLSKINSFPAIKYKSHGEESNFKKILTIPGYFASSNLITCKNSEEVYWVADTKAKGYPISTYSIRKAKLSDIMDKSSLTDGFELFRTSQRGFINVYYHHPISLSPDCNQLVVAMIYDTNGCNKCQKDLYILDANNGNIIKRLTSDGANRVSHEDPWWSPDGQWIAFTSNKDGSNSIWIIRPDGSDLTKLTSDATNDYAPTWSPDSKQIAFTSVINGNHDIYLLGLDKCREIIGIKSSNFENNKIKYNQYASLDSVHKTVILSPAKPWRGGSVWYDKKLPVQKGFTTEFSFRFSDGNNKYHFEKYPGADGIAFVIQNYDNKSMGSLGSGIGYELIPNSFAIEYDTYKNVDDPFQSGIFDPNENHIAVFCNGTAPNLSNHQSQANLATNDAIMPMVNDGRLFYSKIEYNIEPNTMKIWLDSVPEYTNPPVIVLNNIDLSELLNLTCDEYAWMGFTSSTGIVFEKHEILSWQICNNPSSTIIPNPQITSGKDSVCESHIVTYKSNIDNNIDYEWIVEGGTILSGQSTNAVTVKWGTYDDGKITLIHKSKENGCSNFINKQIFIKRLPRVILSGSDGACIEKLTDFKANKIDGVSYKWKVTGGEIIGLDNLDSIKVLWDIAGTERITLIMNFAECKVIDSIEKNIEVHALPEISFNDVPDFCLTDSPVEMKMASPEGGTYYGNGIISNILFPKDAGVGTHEVFYAFTDTETNCKNSAKSKFTILPSPDIPIIFRTQKKLVSSHAVGYQWYQNGNKIDGATNQEFIPNESGQFTVIITDENGCKSDMSAPFYFDITSVDDGKVDDNQIKIYPNPASDEIIIELIDLIEINSIEIYDILGKKMNCELTQYSLNSYRIKTNNLESGIYFVNINRDGYFLRKNFSIIK